MDEGQAEFSRSRRSYVYESSGGPGGRKANKKLFVIIGIVVLLIVIVGSVFSFGKGGNTDQIAITPSPSEPSPTEEPSPTPEEDEETTPTPEATDTPTPEPTTDPVDKVSGLDRSDLSIEIHNGSGVGGAASGASDILSALGYSIKSTANADNFDYENTVIKVKSSSEKFLDLIKSDLAGSYTIGTTSADLSGSSVDALVIIGKN